MSTLRGKRILVTGGAGFLGRHLVRRLVGLFPAEIVTLRNNDCDLRNENDTLDFVYRLRPQVVFHLAAKCGGIGANRAAPATFFEDNMRIGLNTLDAARAAGVEKFILVGTCCSYPKDAPNPLRESDLWNGYPEATNAPYGIAKRTLILYAQTLREQHGFNAISVIPANLYGPGDNFDPATSHVIPALVRKCVEARRSAADRIAAWGTGRPSRDFLFVEDAADGIVRAAESYDGAEPLNLGTGVPISIQGVANAIQAAAKFWGFVQWDDSHPDGQPARWLDTSRAWDLLGWKARTPLYDGLRQTVADFEARHPAEVMV